MPAKSGFKMSKFILGKKLGMSQIFGEDGNVIPVTVIEVEQNVVTQIKSIDKDGYQAVQMATGSKKKISKPMKGHLKELGSFRYLKEFRLDNKGLRARGEEEGVMSDSDFAVGQKLDASVFVVGDTVRVSGVSKGKGFQGVVKRHGFSGMPFSHGHHHVLRHGGSIGQRFPQHTLKGMRMAGHMGARKSTTRGLRIVNVDVENGLLAISGAVPGNKGGLVMIRSQK